MKEKTETRKSNWNNFFGFIQEGFFYIVNGALILLSIFLLVKTFYSIKDADTIKASPNYVSSFINSASICELELIHKRLLDQSEVGLTRGDLNNFSKACEGSPDFEQEIHANQLVRVEQALSAKGSRSNTEK